MQKISRTLLYDKRFIESVCDRMSYDWPLNTEEEEIMSMLMSEYIHSTERKIFSVLDDCAKEYCDRCDSYRFRNKKRRLVCKCAL